MKTKKQAFALVELLVVIAIIGILATLAVVSLQNARSRARDAKRIADVRQMQTALELYYNDVGEYPPNISGSISQGGVTYMAVIPSAPTPPDGDCAEGDNTYSYSPVGSENESYEISFCLGSSISNLSSGDKIATPAGITDIIISPVSQYTLTISKTGTGFGTATSDPSGVDCGATCSYDFDHGSSVVLTANPSTGSTFTGWSGGGCSGTGTCTVSMTEARAIAATFTINTYALTVDIFGEGGTITSSPAGINCGSTCSINFNYNTSVTLTASTSEGWIFDGWNGAGCSGYGTCTVSMTEAKSVFVIFYAEGAPMPP